MSTWQRVCDVTALEGNVIKEFDVEGKKLAVVRAGGEVFAFPLRCPHMDEPLSTGMCDGETLTCSFHLWQWNLKSGKSTGDAEVDLLKYPVKEESGGVFVDLATELRYD
ncbi:MAG: Rieske 2Fe-2S domain-containing protein [Alphaproteobacteria bacterium]|nr:Rieske 2Fe-2S domain-containing protein [Alphaproteobacteria bacterium]